MADTELFATDVCVCPAVVGPVVVDDDFVEKYQNASATMMTIPMMYHVFFDDFW